MSFSFQGELDTAVVAAQSAARFIRDNFDRNLNIRTKNEYDELVTDLDEQAEAIILTELNKNFSEYNVISEESPEIDNKSALSWVIDPLDGTSNLVLGLPILGVSIALLHDNEVVAGVVMNVMRNLCFTASKGQGAFMNNIPLLVSDKTDIKRASIGHIVSFEEKLKPRALDLVTLLRSSCRRMLDTWAPSIEWTLLAQGKLDALVSLGSGQYDRLAGMLIAQESGVVISLLSSPPHSEEDYLLASSNEKLHRDLLELIQKYYPEQIS